MNTLDFIPTSDSSVKIQIGRNISEATHRRVMKYYKILIVNTIQGVIEVVPTYLSISIYYKPEVILYRKLILNIERLFCESTTSIQTSSKLHKIPVLYDGIDIDTVAKTNNLDVKKVIELHTAKEYLIYMLGFTPGFPYLGGMDKRIATPRLKKPRVKIPKGSIGIAGSQTGIYPIDSPGGWQLIGRTPVDIYPLDGNDKTLFKVGDRIKFYEISRDEYISYTNRISL